MGMGLQRWAPLAAGSTRVGKREQERQGDKEKESSEGSGLILAPHSSPRF